MTEINNKLLTSTQFEGERQKDEQEHHQQDEEGLGGHDDEMQEERWVKGAELSDNDRYKALLDYMEKRMEDANQKIKEDEE